MTEVSDFIEQPRVEVLFPGGETRFVHAHYEYADYGNGPAMDEFPRLVPDDRDGIIFIQTIDGRWHAYEGCTSWNGF